MITKKAECNIIGIIGMILAGLGFIFNNEYAIGAGTGVSITALHFRLEYLGNFHDKE